MNPAIDALLAFALTYLVHSTVLVLLVALIVRVFAPRSNPVREALWTIALFGGIGTAALQSLGLDSQSATWRFRAAPGAPAAFDPASGSSPRAHDGAPPASVHPAVGELAGDPLPPRARRKAAADDPAAATIRPRFAQGFRSPRDVAEGAIEAAPAEPRPLPASRRANDPAPDSPALLATTIASIERGAGRAVAWSRDVLGRGRGIVGGALALGAMLGAAYLALLAARSRRALAARERVHAGPLFERLAALRRKLAVHEEIALSVCDSIATPVAFGLRRFEICVPRRSMDLDVDQQDAMLAHEIAHLVRRDPCRLLLARAIESIAFFQPLNRLARRRLFEVVEMRCDAFAVERLGDGLALAGCLAEVASWLHDRGSSSLAPAMAEARSTLSARIECLLDTEGVIAREHRRSWLAPVAFALLPGVALVAPGVAIGAPLDGAGRAIRSPGEAAEIDASNVREEGNAIDVALSEVLVTLDLEIDGLNDEIASLRAVLAAAGRAEFDESLATLEARLERLDAKRRAVDSVWRRMRDAADRADDAPAITALPDPRRKP